MKPSYRALIVDDERLARNDLKSLLSDLDHVEVVGEAGDLSAAIQLIQEQSPDVIFLDIQLTGESGFDLLDKADISAKVIFVTAFDEYAIRAFEVNALDYLLKPVNPERLARSLERLELESREEPELSRPLQYDDRLFITVNNQLRFVKINLLLSISAAGDYSEIRCISGLKGLVQKSMTEWENRLPEQYFCRIHRSTIINMEYIERLEEWFNYAYRVYLKGQKQPYVMSRRYAARLKDKLG